MIDMKLCADMIAWRCWWRNDTIPSVVPDTIPSAVVDAVLPIVDTSPEVLITVPDVETEDTVVVPPDTLPDASGSPQSVLDSLHEELPEELVFDLAEAADLGVALTNEQFGEAVNAIADLTEEQAVALIGEILATAVSADQAQELATNAEVLAVVTQDQAEEIFATVDVGSLSVDEGAALVEVVQEAPTEVRQAFEAEINVFDGVFDEYVPTGSVVSVAVRRAVIASIGVIFVTPVPIARRQTI